MQQRRSRHSGSSAPHADHRAHKALNNINEVHTICAENWRRSSEGLNRPCQAQRFFSPRDLINTIFRPRRYNLTALLYRHARIDTIALWRD